MYMVCMLEEACAMVLMVRVSRLTSAGTGRCVNEGVRLPSNGARAAWDFWDFNSRVTCNFVIKISAVMDC